MNIEGFRKELVRVMPGYNWTVHRVRPGFDFLSATGIQSSGFNRLSTLSVIRREKGGHASYEVKSASHGTKSPWEHVAFAGTLARALRELQQHYQWQAGKFRGLAARMEAGRKPIIEPEVSADPAPVPD